MSRPRCFISPRSLDGISEWDIDFNTLFDSYLGATPAVWLTSQSIVVEMNVRHDRDHGLRLVGHYTNGAEAGSCLASLIVPASSSVDVTHVHKANNSAPAGDICRSLLNLPKLPRKPIIDLETLRDRVLESVIGNGFVLEFTRSLCKNLVPGIETAWKHNRCPWYYARLKIAMDGGFHEVLSAHLADLGTDEVRALRFAGELEATLRLVNSISSLEAAFGHLMCELLGNISILVLRGFAEQSAVPLLREFTKLSDNAARQLPQGPTPVETSQLRDSIDPVCITRKFTEIAMGSLKIAADLGGRMEVAANSATSAMVHLYVATLVCRSKSFKRRDFENVEFRDGLTTELRNEAQTMRELVKKIPPVNLPQSHHWPGTGIRNFLKAPPRTIGGNFANKPTTASWNDWSLSPTATTLVRRKRQNFVNSINPRHTLDMQISLFHDSDIPPVVGYVVTLPPHETAYYRAPDYMLDKTAYYDVPGYAAPVASTVTSTRTITRGFPKYTSTTTIRYTTTSSSTST